MPLLASRFGYVLAFTYLVLAGRLIWTDLHASGGWINLRSMGTVLVTAPSQVTLGFLMKALGIRPINFSDPGFGGYAQIALHLLVTAAVVYLLGYGLEWGGRRLIAGIRG
jgi:hypothetical protein